MKQLFKTLYSVCLSIGQARAATALAREGRYTEARELMAK